MAIKNGYKTSVDIPDSKRAKLNSLLNKQLAGIFDLYSQTKQAHWNVKGVHFYPLHLLFDKLAEELEEYVDIIAERITTLGGVARGTVRMSAAVSSIPELPAAPGDGKTAINLLVERFAKLAEGTRKAIDESSELGDADTADLFTGISRGLDKALWLLEAHLQV